MTFQKLVINIAIIKLIGILNKNDRQGTCEQSYLLHWFLFPVALIKYSLVLTRFIRSKIKQKIIITVIGFWEYSMRPLLILVGQRFDWNFLLKVKLKTIWIQISLFYDFHFILQISWYNHTTNFIWNSLLHGELKYFICMLY